MPIVSGNVSLYNETDGTGILPTPTIGAVGLIATPEQMIGGTMQDGDVLLVLGATAGHLGQSALLAEAFNRVEGDAPHVDLEAEKAHGDFIRTNHALVTTCTDLSDGGLALAAFELSEATGVGINLTLADTGTLFGEDQARYLIACSQENAAKLAAAAGDLPLTQVGSATGTNVVFGSSSASLSDLAATYRSAFAKNVA
jgi:phosphoribosylformylglycinamidine synthase